MSRTWFDKFWTHEDICPRLKYLLEDFDEVLELGDRRGYLNMEKIMKQDLYKSKV